MKRRGTYSHYELAFENFLRDKGLLYIAVNEAKRPIYKGQRVKNFDFIIYTGRSMILADIKGKQFPYESKLGRNYWENWIGLDDGKYLALWKRIFGGQTKGLIIFVYLIKYKQDLNSFKDVYKFKGKYYGLAAIEIDKYLDNSKPRSKHGKGTFNAISISREKMPLLTKPLSHFLKI